MKRKERVPLLPTERLEVCKLCPSFLLWRGVLGGCRIPHARANIHGNAGCGGLRVHGLEHGCPSRPWRHRTTDWNSYEFSPSFTIPETFKAIPETKPRQTTRRHSFDTYRKLPVSQVIDNRLENPSSINTSVIHKREASIKKSDITNVFILWASEFQLSSRYLSFLPKAKWHGLQPFQSQTVQFWQSQVRN